MIRYIRKSNNNFFCKEGYDGYFAIQSFKLKNMIDLFLKIWIRTVHMIFNFIQLFYSITDNHFDLCVCTWEKDYLWRHWNDQDCCILSKQYLLFNVYNEIKKWAKLLFVNSELTVLTDIYVNCIRIGKYKWKIYLFFI